MPVGLIAGIGSALIGARGSKSAANTMAASADRAAQLQKEMREQTRQDVMPWQQSGQVALNELNYLMGLDPLQGLTEPERPDRADYAQRANANPLSFFQGMMGGPTAPRQDRFDQDRWDADMAEYNRDMAAFQQQRDRAEGDPRYGSLMERYEDYTPLTRDEFQASPGYNWMVEQGMDALNKAAAARGNYYAPATMTELGNMQQGLANQDWWNAYGQHQNDWQTGFNAKRLQDSDVWNRLMAQSGQGMGAALQQGQIGAQYGSNIGNAQLLGGAAQGAGQMGVANALAGGIGQAANLYGQQQMMNNLMAGQANTYGSGGPNSMANALQNYQPDAMGY
jgi:hypothetical protein